MITKNESANPYAKMKHEDVLRTAIQLKEALDKSEANNKVLKKALGEANDVLRTDLRSRKVSELQKISDFTVEDLNASDLEELDTMIKITRMAKKPFKSVSDTSGDSNSRSNKLQSMYGRGWNDKMVS